MQVINAGCKKYRDSEFLTNRNNERPPQEPLFSDNQTKLLKSMMASAVAEAMASTDIVQFIIIASKIFNDKFI